MRKQSLCWVIMFLLMPTTAMAYLDPVTGSIVLQGIIGAVSAVLIFGRTIKTKIKSFFGGDNTKQKPEE